MPSPSHIAILGGGITGLSSAFHLTRKFPNATISLIEKSARLGGWIRSERVDVKSGDSSSSMLLESGPRTLRPNSDALLELINLLDLSRSLITTSKSSPAAKQRFLLDPSSSSSPGIRPLPSGIFALLSSSLGHTLLNGALLDFWRLGNRPDHSSSYDESIDAFLSRRFGDEFARVFGSALVHGIYAADSRELSVRAAFPSLWAAEEESGSSVIGGMLTKSMETKLYRKQVDELEGIEEEQRMEYQVGDVPGKLKDTSVYSFKDGLGTLTTALEGVLRKNKNIEIHTECAVKALSMNSDRSIQLQTTSGLSLSPTHVVSALPLSTLSSFLPNASLPHLTANPTSNVTVLNIVFPSSGKKQIHPPGFGYLVSRPKGDYHAHEGLPILGTVFDSCSLSSQDSPSSAAIKLTVMLGGPYPSSHALIPDVLSTLSKHLHGELPEPLAYWKNDHTGCIPTYKPGHLERMEEMRQVLKNDEDGWGGRLEVIGAGVGGVSLGDCVEAGRNAGEDWMV